MGMHRSGTSVLSHAVETLGAHLGSTLLDAAKDNEKGFFENKKIVDLNKKLLHSIDCTWDSLIIPSMSGSQINDASNKICSILTEEFGNSHFFCIKDPRLIRLKEAWLNALTKLKIKPYFILINRHPFEVTESLKKRNSIPKTIGLLLWIEHQANSLSLAIKHNGLIINYDSVLQNPGDAINLLARYLGVDTAPIKRDVDIFCHDFLDQKLKHNEAEPKKQTKTELEQLAINLHGAIKELSLDSSKETLIQAQSILKHSLDYINSNRAMIQNIQNTFTDDQETLSNQLIENEKKIQLQISENNKLKSELDWIQSRPGIQLIKRTKTYFLQLKKYFVRAEKPTSIKK